MAKTKPPVTELEFLKLTANHIEFDKKLDKLNFSNPAMSQHAEYIGAAWFHLGDEHLKEARSMFSLTPIPQRAIFSKSYYAAYSASKCVRYMTIGFVSLKGDDHGKASDLPNDFPNKETWAKTLATLYENRLRADYDNWSTTLGEFSEDSQSAIDSAEAFINAARVYINSKTGSAI